MVSAPAPRTHLALLALAAFLPARVEAYPEIVTLLPSADTTIYSGSGRERSNGGGETFMVGTNSASEMRRALVRFDFGSLPVDAVILKASLKLTLAMVPAGDVERSVSMHRALSTWGENAASNAGTGHGSGMGAPAALGDATWLSPSFGTSESWGSAGGDFVAEASGSALVSIDAVGVDWGDPGLASDVQGWVAGSMGNFGWFFIGDESTIRTNRQFYARESTVAGAAPELMVTYVRLVDIALSAHIDGDSVVLRWNSIPGQLYQLQWSGDLLSDSWTDLGPPVLATATSTEAKEPGVSTNRARYFRIKLR